MRFRIIPLEERIVLDAAGAVDVLNSYHLESVGVAHDGHTADMHDIGPQAIKPLSPDSDHLIDAPLSDEGGVHLMVIDTNVKDAEVLGAASKDPSHVLYYDSSTTSLKELASKIESALHGHKADSIAFVSEGVESGKFMLAGGILVSLDSLQANSGLQAFWDRMGSMINAGGRIDLLACNVAGTEAGQDLVERIDALADSPENDISVAASADLTGNAEWGGNWSLEMGAIDAKAIYFDDNIQAWQGVLDETVMVADIVPGSSSSLNFLPGRAVTAADGTFYFLTNGHHELWKTDGTSEGTVLVKAVGSAENLRAMPNGLIYFSASDSAGTELWRSDGTEAGTFRVADIAPGAISSSPKFMTYYNGEVLFSATGDGNAENAALWSLSGTTLKRVSQIGFMPENITNVNGLIVVAPGKSSQANLGIWSYNGTSFNSIGSALDTYNGNTAPAGQAFPVLNGFAYFSAFSSSTGFELWKSNGITASLVKDIATGSTTVTDSSSPKNITLVGNRIMFTVERSFTFAVSELWSTDGTAAGTTIVKQFGPNTAYKPGAIASDTQSTYLDVQSAINLNGVYVFYMGGTALNSHMMWRSDGTLGGTYAIEDHTFNGKEPTDLTVYNDEVFFLASSNNLQGRSIWSTDGASYTSLAYISQDTNPLHIVNDITAALEGIYFDGYEPSTGQELYLDPLGHYAPVAVNDSYENLANHLLIVSPSENDTDRDDFDILGAVIVQGPAHGTVVQNGFNQLAYKPNFNFLGVDSFTYRTIDSFGTLSRNVATVTVTTTNQPPQATPDSYYVNKNINFNPTLNDTDVNFQSLMPVIMSNPSHGTLVMNPDGTITYHQDLNYYGSDSFTYAAHDGYSLGDTVTVDFLPGIVANDATYTLNQNGSVDVPTLTHTTFQGASYPGDTIDLSNALEILSQPAHGTLTVFPFGFVIYTPNPGYYGADSFTYRVVAPIIPFSNIATISFDVQRGTNINPVAAADSYSVNHNRPLNVISTASGLLANDTDGDGDPLHAQLVSGPANGVLSLNANGTFSYTPNAGFSGIDTFTYRALDDFSGISAPATVSINVGPNPTIITNPDYYIVNPGFSHTTSAATGLLANDINPTNSSVVVDSFGPVPLGSVTLNANGSFTWTPPAHFAGTDSFGYRVYTQQDGVQYVSTGIAYITVSSQSFGDSYAIDKNVSNTLTINLPSQGVLANDSGWERGSIYGPLTATLISGPQQGSLTLNSDGTFTYTANSGFFGTDTFLYRSDYPSVTGGLLGLVSIVVNNSPVANNGSFAVNEDGALNGAVSYSDANNNFTSTPVQLVSGVAHGTLNLQADGNFTYTPAANYYGSDSFTYRVTDSFGFQSNIATVNITVNSVNDAPTFTKGPNITVTPNITTLQTLAGWAKNISAGPNEAGQGLTFSISTDNDAIFAVLPTINSATGTLTFALNSGLTSPSAHATVTLTDAGGASTTQSFDFLSGVLSLVKDIVPAGSGSGHPSMTLLTAYHDKVLFYGLADGTGTSFSLFVSDGTEAGTFVLKNFNQPGTDALRGDFERFTIANDKVYFGLRNELWATDGTVAGTYLVTTLGVNERFMGTSAAFNNEIYFGTRTVFPGTPIGSFYKSDGTAAGTQLVHTFASPQRIMDFMVMNDKLYFNANDVIHGFELWSTDGTTAGTAIVADINPGADFGRGTTGGFRETPVVLNNKLYFLADDGIHGTEVWYTDGTAAGTQMLADLNTEPGFGSFSTNSNSNLIVELNGELYIAATQATTPGLWKSDGTTAGTVLVSSVPDLAGASFSSGLEFTRIGDKLLFVSGDSTIPTSGYELWITDGTTAGTHVLKDIANSPSTGYSSLPSSLNAIGNEVFFYANDGVNGYQLWKTDGTEAGTVALQSVTGGKDLVVAGGNIFIPANLGTGLGEELYAIYGAFNQDPVAADFAVSLQEDNSTIIDLLANVQDPDTIDLDTSIVTGPAHGTLVMNPNGTYTYTPNAHYYGSDSFTYKASDGVGVSNLATVTLTISSVNDAPIANDLSISVAEDASALINLPISDVDHANLDVVIVSGPSHGALVLNGDGSYTYTPEANYYGADSFTYKVGDGLLESALATATINVTAVNDAPTADSFSVLGAEDIPLNISLQGRYRDIDSGSLTVSIINGPAHGTLTPNGDGTYTYTPVENYHGADSFTYRVNDGSLNSNLATVSIAVSSLNDAPTAGGFTVGVTEDIPHIINFPANTSDVESANLTVTIFRAPEHGVLTSNPDGTYTYTPDANYNGSDSFDYFVTDGDGTDSNLATVGVNVAANNDAPVANNFTVNASEDTPRIIDILANVQDIDSSNLTILIINPPDYGSLVDNGNGTYTYTPNANFSGTDSIEYRILDDGGLSVDATVTIQVAPVNDAPTAANLTVNVQEEGTVNIHLGAHINDIDTDLSSLVTSIFSAPAHGTVVDLGFGSFSYTPDANFSGTDSFQYRVSDGSAFSNFATVTINVGAVNDAPIANNATLTVIEDSFLFIDLTPNISDDSAIFTFSIISQPAHGSLSQNPDGTYFYIPDADFNGQDSFTYQANDGEYDSNIGTITIDVTPVNDAPFVSESSVTIIINEDTSITLDLMALSGVNDPDSANLFVVIVNQPAFGTLTSNGDGTYTYTPEANYSGPDSISWVISDGALDSALKTQTIFVDPVNDAPTASNASASVSEDGSVDIDLGAYIQDIDSASLTPVIVDGPLHGSLTLNQDGTYKYTPNANYNGPDSFTFKANDGDLDSSVATVSISVAPVNDAPTASDASISTNEDTDVIIDLPAYAQDVDSANLYFMLLNAPQHGFLSPNIDGTITYTPTPNYSGTDSFTFQVRDGGAFPAFGDLYSNIATVTITIDPVNDAPTASDASLSVNEDSSVDFDLIAYGQDIDSASLSVTLVALPTHGVVSLNLDGTYKYTPNANFSGSDSFTFIANDGDLDSNVATVSISVAPVNDAPTASDASVSVNEDGFVDIDLRAHANDIDSANLTFFITPPANGTLSSLGNGIYRYSPNSNFNGPDSFSFTANDGDLLSNPATISISVAAVNDAPTASNASASANEDGSVDIDLGAHIQDIDSASLTPVIVDGPLHGLLSLNQDGTYKYTPNANYNGSDSFTFKANDGALDSNTATVSLSIAPVNDAPTASDASVSVNEDGFIDIDLRALTNDIDSANLIFFVTPPARGTLILLGDSIYRYSPNSNFNGPDSFSFTANDGDLLSNPATISISVAAVNDAPTASNANASANEDGSVDIDLGAHIQDIDSTSLTPVIVDGPLHGTLSLNLDGTYKYTPNANYNGSDSFTFKANDGALDSNTATVSLSIAPVNDAPVANDVNLTLAEDGQILIDLRAHVSDLDNDNLTIQIMDGTANGSLQYNGNDTWIYIPNPDYFGPDGFTYMVSDGTLDSEPATVSLTITPVNDAPVAADDSYGATEDTPLIIDAANGVLANDTEVDGQGLEALLETGPAHGSLALNADGSFTYTPSANYSGPDSFTYRSSDGSENSIAMVSIAVSPVNDAPVANSDSYTAAAGSTLNVSGPGVLSNDSDIDSTALTASIITGPANGSLTLNTDGSFSYTPNAGYTGADSFTYKASDGSLESEAATVAITVLGNQNVDPTLIISDADRIYKEGNAPTIITTQADVIDPDSPNFNNGVLTVTISDNATSADQLTIVNTNNITTLGSNVYFDGTLIGTFTGGDGVNALQVTFNAAATQANVERVVRHIGFSTGTDTPSTLTRTVTFQVTDGEGGTSAPQSKLVEVLSVNDAPTITTETNTLNVLSNVWTALNAGIAINDADSSLFTITLQVNRGVLKFSDMGGLQNLDFKKTPTMNGLSTLQFTGTLSDVNLALSRLMYLSKYNYVGQDTLFIRVKDNNISDAGSARRDIEEINLIINIQ